MLRLLVMRFVGFAFMLGRAKMSSLGIARMVFVIIVFVMVLVVNLFVSRFIVVTFSSVLIFGQFFILGCILRVAKNRLMRFVTYRSVSRFLLMVLILCTGCTRDLQIKAVI